MISKAKPNNESKESQSHNESQEVEDAMFSGVVATLQKLGLPDKLKNELESWYNSDEASEDSEDDSTEKEEDKGQGESMGW